MNRSHTELLEISGLPPVLVTPQPHASSVSVILMIRAGSRHDPPKRAGSAHLTEHMVFQGTRRHPEPREVVAELDAVGGELNAETDRECTNYYVQLPPEHLELAISSLADLVSAPLLRPANLTKERRVIEEEIAQYLDSPEDFVQELLRQGVWQDHPLAHCELGDCETLATISTRHLREFVESRYRIDRMVLSVAGQTTSAQVEQIARTAPWPAPTTGRPMAPGLPPIPHAGDFLEEQDTEESHLVLAVPAVAVGHPELPALLLLNDLLGGSMTSRLFQEIREVRGLAYDIDSELDLQSDAGLWVISTGVRPERAAEALRVIGHQLGQIARGQFDEAELAHARGHFLGASLLYLEHHRNIADWQARQYLLSNRIPDFRVREQEIRAVTLEQARALAARLLDPAKLALAVVGPHSSAEPLRRALVGCW